MIKKYLAQATWADKAVEQTKKGMLSDNFDTDSYDPHTFVWTEIYNKSEEFSLHADNPPVQIYVEKNSE